MLLDIARDVEAVAPDAWLVNVTNPLTALCRSVTRETNVKTVGLCNEWVAPRSMLSLLFDCGMHEIDPVLGGVNHFPLAMSLCASAATTASRRLRAMLDDPEGAAAAPIWMDPPPRRTGWKVAPADHWSEARRASPTTGAGRALQPLRGAHRARATTTRSSSCPGSSIAGNDYGKAWRVHHYGMAGHTADAEADVAHYESIRDADDVHAHAVGRTGRETAASKHGDAASRGTSREPSQRGQRDNLPDGAVVEIMGIADARGVRGRDAHDGAGDHGRVPPPHQRRRRSGRSKPRSSGDRELVLEAMLADPLAAQLSLRQRRRDDRRHARRDGAAGCRSSRSIAAWLPASSSSAAGAIQWVPKLLIDMVNTPSLGERRDRARRHRPRAARTAWPTSSSHVVEVPGVGITVETAPPTSAPRSTGADYVVVTHLHRRVREHAPRPRDPRALRHQAVGRRHGRARRHHAARCATSPCSSGSRATWKEICPDAWMLNITNPMTALCRAVTRETTIKTVGLCHEVTMRAVHCLSLLLDADFLDFEFERRPASTTSRSSPRCEIAGDDGFERLRDAPRRHETRRDEPVHLPAGDRHTSSRASAAASPSAICSTRNRVKFALFERFGVLPAAGDRHLVEFFPGFLTEESEWGKRWGVELTSIADREAMAGQVQGRVRRSCSAAPDVPDDAVGRDGRAA